jgi:ATP-dependent protease ClpP protease subunit
MGELDEAGRIRVNIFDEIGYFGVTSGDFVDRLNGVDADTIELHIDSPGGDVFDGVAIYNNLRDHKARVEVIVDGIAASIASVIAMAGDTVTMNRGSSILVHEGHTFAIGEAADLRQTADRLDKVNNEIAGIYAARTGGTAEQWLDLMAVTTTFTPDEAVEAGLADTAVAAESGAVPANVSTFDLSLYPKTTAYSDTPPHHPTTPEHDVTGDADTIEPSGPAPSFAAFRSRLKGDAK